MWPLDRISGPTAATCVGRGGSERRQGGPPGGTHQTHNQNGGLKGARTENKLGPVIDWA